MSAIRHSPTIPRLTILPSIVACLFAGIASVPGQAWQEVLRRMPLPKSALPVSRENCISICLTNFQSNTTVKALIFLPGVSDDFYLLNRDRPKLNIIAGNLFEALSKVTNSTQCQLTFNAPFLLIHMARDSQEPSIIIKNKSRAALLGGRQSVPRLICADMHWEALQPVLQKSFGSTIRPLPDSREAWHFNRHNLAAWGLNDWELLSAISLTARTTALVEKYRITFKPNRADSKPQF